MNSAAISFRECKDRNGTSFPFSIPRFFCYTSVNKIQNDVLGIKISILRADHLVLRAALYNMVLPAKGKFGMLLLMDLGKKNKQQPAAKLAEAIVKYLLKLGKN